MTDQETGNARRGIDYGIDAPGLVRMMFIFGTVALLLALLSSLSPWPGYPWGVVVVGFFGVIAAYTLGMGCHMVYTSKVVKVRKRERLLDQITWTGSESVLDIGCGRGLMLIGAAKRLATGKAVGIDVWHARTRPGTSPTKPSRMPGWRAWPTVWKFRQWICGRSASGMRRSMSSCRIGRFTTFPSRWIARSPSERWCVSSNRAGCSCWPTSCTMTNMPPS